MWTEVPKGKNKKPVNKDRFISYVSLYILYRNVNLTDIRSCLIFAEKCSCEETL
jgi:hypothetical protein